MSRSRGNNAPPLNRRAIGRFVKEKNMPVTLFVLANTLIFHDEDADCPFCKKTEWGEEKHDKDCPFGLAYLALKEHAQQSVQPTLLESGQKIAPESINPYPCDTN
jgi:hypothetical protein